MECEWETFSQHSNENEHSVTYLKTISDCSLCSKNFKINKELLLHLNSCRNKANIMNNINMSTQETAMPKIKNDTDDNDAYHPSYDPKPHQSSYELYTGKKILLFSERSHL